MERYLNLLKKPIIMALLIFVFGSIVNLRTYGFDFGEEISVIFLFSAIYTFYFKEIMPKLFKLKTSLYFVSIFIIQGLFSLIMEIEKTRYALYLTLVKFSLYYLWSVFIILSIIIFIYMWLLISNRIILPFTKISRHKNIIRGLIIAPIIYFTLSLFFTNLGKEITNSKIASLKKTGNSVVQRFSHTAQLLPNGKVLIAGGLPMTGRPVYLDSAELYDPETGKFTLTGKMHERRCHLESVLLKDGRVLIVGGVDDRLRVNPNGNLRYAEIYDYRTGKFSKTGHVNIPRKSSHTLTLLKDGKVLLAGGITPTDKDNCEIYNPKTGKFKLIQNMNYVRWDHTSTLLKDGQVLITGGNTMIKDGIISNTAEIYDPKTNKFTKTESMHYARREHVAVLLKDGRVLVVGGQRTAKNVQDDDLTVKNMEIYNPKTGKFEAPIKMSEKFPFPTITLLKNGKVLIIGAANKIGTSSGNFAQIYDPVKNTFEKFENREINRGSTTLTLLKDERVLMVGGVMLDKARMKNVLFEYKGK